MSAPEFRRALEQRIQETLYGDGKQSGGIVATTLSGAPKEYAIYRDLTGQIRAYNAILQLIAEVWDDLYNPKPTTEPKNVNTGVH